MIKDYFKKLRHDLLVGFIKMLEDIEEL